MAEVKKSNLKVLREIRIKGKAVGKGSVIAKSEFANKGDWLNLCGMKPARLEETDDGLKKIDPVKAKKDTKLPGAK